MIARRARWRVLLTSVALLALVPASVLAANNRLWQVDVSPSTIFINTETNLRLTVTNTGPDGGGQEITCVRVQVPGSFDITDARVLSVHGETSGAAYDAWIVVRSGNVVTFKEPGDDYPLVGSSPPEDEAVFRITGESNALLAMQLTMNAADHPGKASETDCGSGDDFATKRPTILVLPLQGPTPPPTPAPTPTPTPQPTPTPTPQPTPTPHPTPVPTAKPTPTPTRPPTATATPRPNATSTPAATARASGLPSAEPSPVESASPSSSATIAPDASLPAPTEPPAPVPASDDPGSGGRPSDGPQNGGFLVRGEDDSGGGPAPVEGMDDTAISVLAQLPGGLLPFAGPAVVLGFPGLLVLVAVGAQAFGALAWLPVARRKLGAFGLRTKS